MIIYVYIWVPVYICIVIVNYQMIKLSNYPAIILWLIVFFLMFTCVHVCLCVFMCVFTCVYVCFHVCCEYQTKQSCQGWIPVHHPSHHNPRYCINNPNNPNNPRYCINNPNNPSNPASNSELRFRFLSSHKQTLICHMTFFGWTDISLLLILLTWYPRLSYDKQLILTLCSGI